MTENTKSNFTLSGLFYVDRARRSHTEYRAAQKNYLWQDTGLKLNRVIFFDTELHELLVNFGD